MISSQMKFLALLLMTSLASCQQAASSGQLGGIVDNGNKPKETQEKQGEEHQSPAADALAPAKVNVLANYFAFLPDGFNLTFETEGSSRYENLDGDFVEFSAASELCSATEPEGVTQRGFTVDRCSASRVRVSVDGAFAFELSYELSEAQFQMLVESFEARDASIGEP